MELEPDRPVSRPKATIRRAVRAMRLMRLRVRLGRRMTAGTDVALGAHCLVLSPRHFRLGNRVRVGRNLHVEADVILGDDVLISSNVAILSNDHAFDDPHRTVFDQGRHPTATVRIEGDNLIGFGTIIVGPVTIGRGVIVGAGSLVTRDLPPYTVCLGRPARAVRPRFLTADAP